ncbi:MULTISPECIES: electron transport complex subunit RsxC [unclassified Pantoea]|uniref:electron transport complex subunit RsxC n=1 Tax=unclassified Pantoea TaxID=2630326 RepID=UPI001CD37198|nr:MULTISPECIES: electron transport complex subunit RsxC [unclassified Pantoea]MCA1175111.1 electron transport complex subunit RsxC [Pantoea sp. alder69]MCA1250073.1 electron transport complex subunit RsxC [Pantoea sp. alder70]MCA1263972.1 electron transport complex subunit RsxC [Pantoea sp. alder81]
MLNLLKLFRKEKLWDFQGGIHPPEMKTQSNGTPLSQLPLPEQFIIPLKQHIGHEGEICVSPGDHVLRGQPLTFGSGRMLPVHAPTSGTIEAIAPHMTAHPSGLSELCIFLRADGEDRWTTLDPQPDFRALPREDVVKRIHEAGVAGLGGAGFPTATKLRGGLRGVKTLIINAAECEPYITADDRLMQDCAAEVLEGCRILAWVLQAERVMIGIEDNKPEAIAALKQALGGDRELQLRVIPTKYPSGGAKQLTKILTGVEVPHGGRSTDIGVLMQNVGTAWAVKRAIIDGEPITERVVTLTGEAIAQPRNVWGRLGTPVSHLLHHVDFTPGSRQMVIMGGPLMGFTLPSLNVPLVKISNCILAPSASEMGNNEEEQSCIRCSACADACPAKLLPQQLFWYSQGGDHEKARAHNIDDCIECGACAYVCPSNIPLVQYYRQEKAELRAIDLEAKRTAEAKARFEARQARLEREKLAREARHEEAKQRVARSDQGERDAAIARVKSRAAKTPEQETAEREARHAQALAQQAEKQSETQALSRQSGDPRKAAVEAAIARAKAKKSGVAEQPVNDVAETSVAEADPRKAAVEAAIARAKAKKAAAAAGEQAPEPADAAPAAEVDPRKAAVEAAIARAKAKKAAAAAGEQVSEPADAAPAVEVDPRKAAIEAAIARAKAKKAAAAAGEQVSEPADAAPAAEVDPRKAAVEAAIARAKAKKAAAAAGEQASEPADAAPAAEVDPRKAAVEAAIARAKAKKAAAAAGEQASEPANAAPAAEVDPRKAAVEAAIARAKAKKAAAAEQASVPTETAPESSSEVEAAASPDSADPRKAAIAAAVARAKARKAQQQPSTTEE